jgi:hypothetical protein
MYEGGEKLVTRALDPLSNPSPNWREVVETIPSVFGRLVYLRSLSDSNNLVIGHAALQIFSYWLRLGLSEQVRDLRGYLTGSGAKLPVDSTHLVPPAARDVERQLFLTDMETLAGLLRVEGDEFPTVL